VRRDVEPQVCVPCLLDLIGVELTGGDEGDEAEDDISLIVCLDKVDGREEEQWVRFKEGAL
jgi:hypothetical protein